MNFLSRLFIALLLSACPLATAASPENTEDRNVREHNDFLRSVNFFDARAQTGTLSGEPDTTTIFPFGSRAIDLKYYRFLNPTSKEIVLIVGARGSPCATYSHLIRFLYEQGNYSVFCMDNRGSGGSTRLKGQLIKRREPIPESKAKKTIVEVVSKPHQFAKSADTSV